MAQKLGEILTALGSIGDAQLREALRRQQQSQHQGEGKRIGEVLIAMGITNEAEVLRGLAKQQRVPFADPSLFQHIDPRLRRLVPKSKALHYALVPVRYLDGNLILATCDAENLKRKEELVDALGQKVRLVLASRQDIQAALGQTYAINPEQFGQRHLSSAPKRYPTQSAVHPFGQSKPSQSSAPASNNKRARTNAEVAREVIEELPNDSGVFKLTTEALNDLHSDADEDASDTLVRSLARPPKSGKGDDELVTVFDRELAARLRDALQAEGLDPDLQSASETFRPAPLTTPPQEAKQKELQRSRAVAPGRTGLSTRKKPRRRPPVPAQDTLPPPAASAPPPPSAPVESAHRRSRRELPINRVPTGLRREKSETLVRPDPALLRPPLPAPASLPQPPRPPDAPRANLVQVPRRQVPRQARRPALNSSFGGYTLLRKVATGGMAEVFEARSRGIEGIARTVAIKRILPNMTDSEEFVTMFVDEAKITVQLSHVNIGQVYELGRVEDDYFIAMEYIRGRDLNNIFADAYRHKFAIPIPIAVFVMQQVLEGLDYAHQKRGLDRKPLNIVHRDVSPANVLCSFEGQVKIIDFGIAKAVSKVSLTRPGLIKGKISYMSPEQMRGQHLDRRSDIFAAGIILYEMLAGRRLFGTDSDVETIRNVLKGQIEAIELVRPEVPADLAEVVARCLQRDPKARYAWASEASQALQRVLINHDFRHPRDNLAAYMEARFAGVDASEEAS